MFAIINFERVNIVSNGSCKVIFKCENIDICHELPKEKTMLIKKTFNRKIVYKENHSCGFSENVSVKFKNSQTFCFARDGCPIIFWKEKNKYFKVSEEEILLLHDLLEEYGFYFPCV